MNQGRAWCFTWNNYPDDWKKCMESSIWESIVQYAVIGKEKGEKEHTPLLQGFLYLKSRRRLTTTKQILQNRTIHAEKCRGNMQQNVNYCKKEGEFIEYGEQPIIEKMNNGKII